jgi:hypothetical protein
MTATTPDQSPVNATPDADTPTAARPGPSRGRRWAVNILVILAVMSTFTSTVAVWAHQVLLDTDAWVRTVGPLVDDEEVTDAVAQYVVSQIFVLIDVEEFATDALPDQAGFLAGPLTSAAEQFLTDQVANLLQTDQFKEFWVEANRRAHSQAVRLLRGESGLVSVKEGEVTLNLLPLLAGALQQLDDLGVLPDSVDVPDVHRDTPPDEAVAAFEKSFGVDLKDDFAQFTVYNSSTLAQAQDAVMIFDRAVVASVVVTVLLAVAAIALARPRRRTILQLSLGVVGGFVVAWAAIEIATNEILGLISDDVDRSAATQVVDSILGNLRGITRIVSAVAIVATIVAFVTGDSAWARRTRAFVRSIVSRSPLPADEQTSGTLTALGWIAKHRDGLRVAGLIGALAAALVLDLTVSTALVILLVLVVYEVVLAIIPEPSELDGPPPDEGGPPPAEAEPVTAGRDA